MSQSAHTWCHVVVVYDLIGPQSRRYTWCTFCKTSCIFVEIRLHNQDWIPQNGLNVNCIPKQSEEKYEQIKSHHRCKQNSSLVFCFITTCRCVADRRGDQSFPCHELRPRKFVWISLKLKIAHFVNLTCHLKCQIGDIVEWFDTSNIYFTAKSMQVRTIHENKPRLPRTKMDNLRYGPTRTVRMVGETISRWN